MNKNIDYEKLWNYLQDGGSDIWAPGEVAWLGTFEREDELVVEVNGSEVCGINYCFTKEDLPRIVNDFISVGGTIEVINRSTSSNIMCKYTEENGDYFFAQFFVQRGTSGDATVQSFEFVSATGRWEEMLGKKCIGAYTSMQQKRFMWQGKCDISDATLESVKNYIKPE